MKYDLYTKNLVELLFWWSPYNIKKPLILYVFFCKKTVPQIFKLLQPCNKTTI